MSDREGDALAAEADLDTIDIGVARTFDRAALPAVLLDLRQPDIPIRYANPAFLGRTGYQAAEALGRPLPLQSTDGADARIAAALRVASGLVTDVAVRRRDGTGWPVRLHLMPVSGTEGTPSRWCLVIAQEPMQAEPSGGDMMLRDLKHRIMNNLQFILGLIELQNVRATAPETKAAFQAFRGRIEALSTVYRQLYTGEGLRIVNLGSYLGELAGHLAQFHDPARVVTVTVSAEPVSLGFERAFPLGLIVTELMVNSYKHAFAGLAGGRIDVGISRPHADRIEVTVGDDGWGLGERTPADAGRGRLGMMLVRSLAGQIGATLRTESAGGFRVTLDLPADAGDDA